MSTRGARRPWRFQELGLALAILVLGVLLALGAERILVRGEEVNNFLRAENLLANVLTPLSWTAILALGATIVIVSGGIDISVGSVFGLSALGVAAVLQELPQDASGWESVPLALGVALCIGVACGTINGVLVVTLAVHPFLITLGTLSIFRGLALVLVESKSLPELGRSLPASFAEDGVGRRLALGDTFVQPVPMLVMFAATLACGLFLARTIRGRELYAIGGNAEAARFAGIAVGRAKWVAYALGGAAAGLAGFLSAGFYRSANTATGEGAELVVIAAAVVGGASLAGGRGTALGALLGALLIKLIENGIDVVRQVDLGLATLSISKDYAKIILGATIVIAVALDRASARWRSG